MCGVRCAGCGMWGSVILQWLREDGAFSGSQLVLRQGGIEVSLLSQLLRCLLGNGHGQQRCCISEKISKLRLDVQRRTKSVLYTCHTQGTESCSRVHPDEPGPQFRKTPLVHVSLCDAFVGRHFYETHHWVAHVKAQTGPDSSCVRKPLAHPPARSLAHAKQCKAVPACKWFYCHCLSCCF